MNDTLMRFFDKCIKLVQEVDNNPSALVEITKFKKGPEMRRVQEKIADRLNVPDILITHGHIGFVYYVQHHIKRKNDDVVSIGDDCVQRFQSSQLCIINSLLLT